MNYVFYDFETSGNNKDTTLALLEAVNFPFIKKKETKKN